MDETHLAEVAEIRRSYQRLMQEELRRLELSYYRGKFPQLALEKIIYSSQYLQVNATKLHWEHDNYLNGCYRWEPNEPPPLDLLPVFAAMVTRYEQQHYHGHSYCYRLTQGLYIRLVTLHIGYEWPLSPEYLLELLRQADNLPAEAGKGFRRWLLHRDYLCYDGGALAAPSHLGNWDGRAAFETLLATEKEVA